MDLVGCKRHRFREPASFKPVLSDQDNAERLAKLGPNPIHPVHANANGACAAAYSGGIV